MNSQEEDIYIILAEIIIRIINYIIFCKNPSKLCHTFGFNMTQLISVDFHWIFISIYLYSLFYHILVENYANVLKQTVT